MKKDLQIAFHWFTHPNNTPQSYLTAEGMQIVDEVQTALSKHDLSLARLLTQNLFDDAMRDRREVGEILVRGAIYGFLLGGNENYQFAKDQFRHAVDTYFGQDLHYWAISLWFLGFVYWHLPEYKQDAIAQWKYCLRIFDELSYSAYSENADWYQKIRFQILESFFLTRIKKVYFPLTRVGYIKLLPHQQPPQKLPERKKLKRYKTYRKQTQKPIVQKTNLILSLPIYQYVPAGGWGVVEQDKVDNAEWIINSDEINSNEIGYSIIDNTLYKPKDLIGSGNKIPQDGRQFVVIKVKGTSMNKLDIQDGDYVVIRRQQEASNNDIVLVERLGIDSEATLKRYYQKGNKIELRPDSDDPSHKVFYVEKQDMLRILGIAIAVFKPILGKDIEKLNDIDSTFVVNNSGVDLAQKTLNQLTVQELNVLDKLGALRIQLRDVEGSTLHGNLLNQVIEANTLISMVYTKFLLINENQIQDAFKYDEDLAKYLRIKLNPKHISSNYLLFLQTVVSPRYYFKIFQFNQKKLTEIQSMPYRILRMQYTNPFEQIILGLELLLKAIDMGIKAIPEKKKASLELNKAQNQIETEKKKEPLVQESDQIEILTKKAELRNKINKTDREEVLGYFEIFNESLELQKKCKEMGISESEALAFLDSIMATLGHIDADYVVTENLRLSNNSLKMLEAQKNEKTSILVSTPTQPKNSIEGDANLSDLLPSPASAKKKTHRLPAFQYVPAGGWMSIPEPSGYGVFETGTIQGLPHQMKSVPSDRKLILLPNERYVYVRVKGNSLNKKDIESGDYVLIKMGNSFEQNDIVLAVQRDKNTYVDLEATLKRIRFLDNQGKQVELLSESTEEIPPIKIDQNNLVIYGTVIAVLKPLKKV